MARTWDSPLPGSFDSPDTWSVLELLVFLFVGTAVQLVDLFLFGCLAFELFVDRQAFLVALELAALDALVLAVVVAGGHRHQQAFHPAFLLAPQHAKAIEVLAEVFVDAAGLV